MDALNQHIAIAGAGPAGAALAAYLTQAGIPVTLYNAGRRPPLLVGESLVPATIPYLQDLGVEDEIRDYSVYKPGATFTLSEEVRFSFVFADVRGAQSTYAYNVPRDRFDTTILEAARRGGARVVDADAELEAGPDGSLQLTAKSLEEGGFTADAPPSFIVDATGRARTTARLLKVPAHEGERRDLALFAHMEGVPLVNPGDVHTDRLERGWAWRIPLPGKISVGLVVPEDHAAGFGGNAEEQFDAIMQSDPAIRRWGGSPKRLTRVMRYNNYQLISDRAIGPNWAMVGDSSGFVDPVFSSGLLIAFAGAKLLAEALTTGTPAALRHYETHAAYHLSAWQRVIPHFYSGRLMTLLEWGESLRDTIPGRLFGPHLERHLPRVFTGETTMNRYSVRLTDKLCRYATNHRKPDRLAVH